MYSTLLFGCVASAGTRGTQVVISDDASLKETGGQPRCPKATPYASYNGKKCCKNLKDEKGQDLTFESKIPCEGMDECDHYDGSWGSECYSYAGLECPNKDGRTKLHRDCKCDGKACSYDQYCNTASASHTCTYIQRSNFLVVDTSDVVESFHNIDEAEAHRKDKVEPNSSRSMICEVNGNGEVEKDPKYVTAGIERADIDAMIKVCQDLLGFRCPAEYPFRFNMGRSCCKSQSVKEKGKCGKESQTKCPVGRCGDYLA